MASLTTQTPPRSGLENAFRMIANYDWWLMLSTAILIIFGLMSLYSIDYSTHSGWFKHQLLYLAIGAVPFLVFLTVRPALWRKFAPLLYIANLGMLLLIFAIGSKKGGDAQRWIEIGPIQFQPSEPAKILLILGIAAFWANRQDIVKKLSAFLLSFFYVVLPMALIFKQPHLGATMVVFAAWLAISLAMGTKVRFVGLAVVAGIAALLVAISVPGLLDDYQLKRIKGLFHPDPTANGYQVDHGLTAIGSGALTGKGYLKGSLKATKYVPAQQTDFIVTVLGEEGGLVGGALLLATYAVFFSRIWWIMIRAEDVFHKGVLAGVITVLTFHTVANLGMVLGMLPVVGLWLPFMSYGGTAMWLCLSCVGLVLNIKAREDVGSF